MITDRDDLLDLAIDVHDCAGSVRRGAGLPQFAGWNFRASEMPGAIARVQLGRLDGLLERMRANQAPAERGRRPAGPDAAAGERRRRRRRDLPDRVRRGPPSLPRRGRGAERRGRARDADLRPGHSRPAHLSVLGAGARRDRGGGSRAGLPADARPARARDPRRRVAALRRAGPRRDRVRLREGGQAGPARDGPRRRRRRRARRPGEHSRISPHARPIRARASPSRARRCAKRSARATASRPYADYRALLDAGELDAVVICSPAQRTPRSCSPRSTRGCTSSSRSRCASRSRTPTRSSPRATGPEGRPGRDDEALRPACRARCSRSCPSPPSRSVTSASSSTTRSSSRTSSPARSSAARTSRARLIEAGASEAEQVHAAVGDDSRTSSRAF